MSETLLQILGALIVGLIGGGGTIYIGLRKTQLDTRIATTTASDALRDDLLALVEKYELREKTLIDRLERSDNRHDEYVKRNEQLQEVIKNLRAEIDQLRTENAELKRELRKTQKDLEEFDKKVYYRTPTT
jgi:chromosome segregation ATPase